MRAAPAFSVPFDTGRAERGVRALLGGLCTAAVGAWLWSHVDAAAGFVGLGSGAWGIVVAAAAAAGGCAGWLMTSQDSGTVHWQHGQWTLLRHGVARPEPGSIEAVFDLGGWMLLKFHPQDDGRASWLSVRRQCAGAAWHALRATLFAPGAAGDPRGAAGGTQP